MGFTIGLRRVMSCLLVAIMLMGTIAVSPYTVSANAAEDSASTTTTFDIGDNVTIKLGAKDYQGAEIDELYMYLVYTVTAVSKDKVTIRSSYYVSAVSYAVELTMRAQDLELKTWAETNDSDTDVEYVIGIGSDVLIKKGAWNVDKDKPIGSFWSVFTFTVKDIDEDGIATVSCRLTLDYVNRMGISSDTIANIFGIDPENQWLNIIYTVLTGVGYDVKFRTPVSDLTLVANGVASSIKAGIYKLNKRVTVAASTFDAANSPLPYEEGFKTLNISIPEGTEVVLAGYANGYLTAYVKLNNKNYVTSKILLSDCTLVREGRELFSSNGLDEGSYVKVTDLYGVDASSFSAPYEWFFEDVDGVETPKIADVLFKIERAYGDGAYIVPVSPALTESERIIYSFVIPADYLKSAAGTFRTKVDAKVYEQTYNSQTDEYSYEEVTTFKRNSVFYSDGKVVDGMLFVRYNGYHGCIKVENLEYVSSNIFNYTNYKVGDILYVKSGTEKDYDGEDIFAERDDRNYFGVDYADEIYVTEFEVAFVANDWVELRETDRSKEENGRGDIKKDEEFRVILPVTKVSETATRVTEQLGDVDLDTEVTISDVALIQQHLAQLAKNLTSEQLNNADVDGDGKVTVSDVAKIQQYLAQLIKRF